VESDIVVLSFWQRNQVVQALIPAPEKFRRMSMTVKKVDAHQHFWNLDIVEYSWLVPEYGPLYRTFGPQELEPQLKEAGIDLTVLVQSANSYDDTKLYVNAG
jgi:predicted TIM-barrel fold metal-dependent hydrolase